MPSVTYGTGSEDDPWILKTPSLSSDYQAWRDDKAKLPALVVQVGTTRLSYQLRCLDDAVAMLQQPVQPGTLEAWARDDGNPVGGYYGLRKGYRGRFANYVTPVLELLGKVELEHGPRNNRVRAK